ncbi:hypothetical protein B4098_0609 [Heyndrickxia coagulans]|uniref:Uncharacterized protein n=1 Tax=Heyndrickxia coagulans TaxID=1398 RepID=A0A150JTD8_HEYCO|nr:hypothetical protein B4098_0609 [Heyndrickxia coagulans]
MLFLFYMDREGMIKRKNVFLKKIYILVKLFAGRCSLK